MKRALITTLILLLSRVIFSQFDPGAKQISLSHSNVGDDSDVFTLFNNAACLQQIKFRELGLFYSPSPFGLKELSNAYFAYAEPTNAGCFAVGGMKYGFELYSEYRFTIGYANNLLEGLSAGIAVNYHSVKIKNYGTDYTFYVDAGISLIISEGLLFGFSAKNLNRASFGREKDQIPVLVRSGISYYPVKDFSLNCGFEKEPCYKENLLFGANYNILNVISVASGFSTEVKQFTVGFGIRYSIFDLEYAFANHNALGGTHQVGLIVRFKN